MYQIQEHFYLLFTLGQYFFDIPQIYWSLLRFSIYGILSFTWNMSLNIYFQTFTFRRQFLLQTFICSMSSEKLSFYLYIYVHVHVTCIYGLCFEVEMGACNSKMLYLNKSAFLGTCYRQNFALTLHSSLP